MKKMVFSLFLLTALYFIIFIGLGLSKDYKWSDMDWDNSGMVSVFEVMDAVDIGLRKSAKGCREYYSLKDGLPVKDVCSE